jgi:hypothetical protein
MSRIVGAAFTYFALVYALGFLLGALRVLVVIPQLGAVLAVMLEAPILLAASWWICAWLVERRRVPPNIGSRLAMGAIAFTVLMLFEFGLGLVGFGRSIAAQLAAYRETSAQLGLLAQVAFAAFPLIQLGGSAQSKSR